MVTINPAVFVSPPYLACPRCGKQTFGVLGVSRDRVSDFVRRGCPTCRRSEQSQLPPVTKRVLYIDQPGVSNLMRVADSEHRREGHHSEFYRRLFVQLLRLVRLQAIVCPQSTTHERESACDDRIAPALLAVLRALSAGVRFEHSRLIENGQAVQVALAWHAQQPFVFDRSTTSGAFRNNVNAWMPHLRIAVNELWSPQDVAAMRAIRDEAVHDMAPVYADWQEGERLKFDERLALEGQRGYGRTRINLWAEREKRILEAPDGGRPVDPNDIAKVAFCPVWRVVLAFTKLGLDPTAAAKRAVEFFLSDAVLRIPAVHLRSMLNATLAREKQSSTKPPDRSDRGTGADFGAISTAMPFCAAMFVDHKCSEYLRQQPLAVKSLSMNAGSSRCGRVTSSCAISLISKPLFRSSSGSLWNRSTDRCRLTCHGCSAERAVREGAAVRGCGWFLAARGGAGGGARS